jgi:hypothetical protein
VVQSNIWSNRPYARLQGDREVPKMRLRRAIAISRSVLGPMGGGSYPCRLCAALDRVLPPELRRSSEPVVRRCTCDHGWRRRWQAARQSALGYGCTSEGTPQPLRFRGGRHADMIRQTCRLAQAKSSNQVFRNRAPGSGSAKGTMLLIILEGPSRHSARLVIKAGSTRR